MKYTITKIKSLSNYHDVIKKWQVEFEFAF